MHIRFGYEIVIGCPGPVVMFLALSTHPEGEPQITGRNRVQSEPFVPADDFVDHYGNRITRVVAPPGETRLWLDCVAEVDGLPDPVVPDAWQVPVEDLPFETLQYLLPSRYCDSDKLYDEAWARFGAVPGGWGRVQAICDFVHNHLTFGYQFGRSTKTASECLVEKTGVCRDFAHLSIALCRAMNIPARYATGYLGDIGIAPGSAPGDFCAWFEAWLGGRWYTFDARYNTPRIGRIVMARGKDASNVAMITSFGDYQLKLFRVWTDQIGEAEAAAMAVSSVSSLPDAPVLVSNVPASGLDGAGETYPRAPKPRYNHTQAG